MHNISSTHFDINWLINLMHCCIIFRRFHGCYVYFLQSSWTLSVPKTSTLLLEGHRIQLQQLSSSFHFPCVSNLRVCYSAPHAKWLAPACIISTALLCQQSGTNWARSEASQHSVHDGPNSSAHGVWGWSDFNVSVRVWERAAGQISVLSESVDRRSCSFVTSNLIGCVCDSSAHGGNIHKELFILWVIIFGFIFYINFPPGNLKNGLGLHPSGLKQPSLACLCLPSLSQGWGQKLSTHVHFTKKAGLERLVYGWCTAACLEVIWKDFQSVQHAELIKEEEKNYMLSLCCMPEGFPMLWNMLLLFHSSARSKNNRCTNVGDLYWPSDPCLWLPNTYELKRLKVLDPLFLL